MNGLAQVVVVAEGEEKAGHGAEARVAAQGGDKMLDHVVPGHVVGVHRDKEFAAGLGQGAVAGGADAGIFLAQETETRVPRLLLGKNLLRQRVGGAIVDNDDLQIAVALGRQGVQHLGQIAAQVIEGDADRHQARLEPAALPRSSILDPRSSILDPRSSILDPRSLALCRQPSVVGQHLAVIVDRIGELPATGVQGQCFGAWGRESGTEAAEQVAGSRLEEHALLDLRVGDQFRDAANARSDEG